MRKVSTLQKAPWVQPDVVTKVVPAPTDGWDAISPLAVMDPKRAPILINWVPRPGWVEVRAGYQPWALLGSSVPVESLMVWRGSGTNQKMFAGMDGSIFDVSTLGSASVAVTGFSSDRWQYVNFTPAAAPTVIQVCNGIDRLQMYDGTTWTVPNITGLPGGLNSSCIVNIAIWKRRIWYCLNDNAGRGTTVAAFMGTDAVTGAIGGTIDLGALWNKGGYLVAIGDWTIDGGNGPDDYIVFLSSQGQATVYQGTDPTSATAFVLVGTFDLAPPIGRRCMTKLGSDIGLITQQGVIPISQALPFDPSADRSVALTSRIQNAMASASNMAKANFGWQLISFPNQQLGILNVPLTENSGQVQYVMDVLTGAWCQFQGWTANCFEIYQDNLYWGGNVGDVNQGYIGGSDLLNSIQADMQCAFNYFDDPGRIKRMTMVQPLLTVGGNITPTLSVDEDFATSSSIAPVTILAAGALWDTAIWDVDVWGGGNVTFNKFLSTDAIGHALAVHMSVNVVTGNTLAIGEFDLSVFDSAVFDASLPGTAPVLQVNAFNAIMEMGGLL